MLAAGVLIYMEKRALAVITILPMTLVDAKLFPIYMLIWLMVIFSFSAKKADESTVMSHSVGKLIGNIVIPEYRSWPEDKQEQFAEKIDFPVRKCAHASEYAVLGVLMLGTAYSFAEDRGKKNRLLCWCAGTAYAATDEFHQLFVPGRSCQFRDVCIDSAGILTSIVLFSLIKHQIAKYNEKKKVAKNVKNQGKSLDKNHDS